MSTLDQAKEQIEAFGPQLPTGHPKADGKFHRYGPGKKAWYKLNEIHDNKTGTVLYSGSFGDYQGLEPNTQYIAMDWSSITPEDRAAAEARRRELEVLEAEKKAQEAANAAVRANMQWAEASKEGSSPYCERKQITAPGVRYQADGTMLVPMVVLESGGARLVGLQKIAPDGEKRYSTGMAKTGALCPIGRVGADDSVVFAAEGYATGRSVRMASDDVLAGFVLFDAGSIMDGVLAIRQLHPHVHILICADDDFLLEKRVATWLLADFKLDCPIEIDGIDRVLKATDGTSVQVLATWRKDARGVAFIEVDARAGRRVRMRSFENAGIAKATAAARAVGNASIVCPRFAKRGNNKWTDFNDLRVQEGLMAVTEQLTAAILAAMAPAAAAPVLAEAPPAAEQASDVVPLKATADKKAAAATSAAAGGGNGGAGRAGSA